MPHLPPEEQGDASFSHEEMRHCLVLPLEDEVTPHSPAGRQGITRPLMRRRGILSLEDACLVPAREDKASHHSPAGRRDDVSSPREETMHHLVALFPRKETHDRCTI
ncbi:hypothetical protein BHM03_00061712 [Ensete ventricosum]|nr:hypothetical protein BHM03_00061712 [Ensete ventricosum]